MALAVKGTARLRMIAGKAQPSPAIGQALGPLGVNMVEFCKQFNDRTAKYNKDRNIPIPVNLTAYEDRTYDFMIKSPPTVWFLKQAAAFKVCDSLGKKRLASVVTGNYEIAKIQNRTTTCNSTLLSRWFPPSLALQRALAWKFGVEEYIIMFYIVIFLYTRIQNAVYALTHFFYMYRGLWTTLSLTGADLAA